MILETSMPRCNRLGIISKNVLDDYNIVGNIGKHLTLYVDTIFDTKLILVDNRNKQSKIVFSCYLTKPKRKVFPAPVFQVCIVEVDTKYRGFDLASKCYALFLKKNPGVVLCAGSLQTPGGKYVWNRLCGYKNIGVYAVNPKTKDFYDCYPTEYGMVESEVPIYENEGRNPYYLYAVATK